MEISSKEGEIVSRPQKEMKMTKHNRKAKNE